MSTFPQQSAAVYVKDATFAGTPWSWSNGLLLWITPSALPSNLDIHSPPVQIAMHSSGRFRLSLVVVGQSEFYRISLGGRTGPERPSVVD